MIFPQYRDGTQRISEQEARFLFVRELEKVQNNGFAYSVETPTKAEYCFSGNDCRSGCVDVCLYDTADGKYVRKHLVEFKAHNVDVDTDFQKLLYDADGLQNYFVHIIKNSNSATIPSIESKYNAAIACGMAEQNRKPTSQVCIFLMDMGKNVLHIYDVVDGKVLPRQ
jgi:hypothetical protein